MTTINNIINIPGADFPGQTNKIVIRIDPVLKPYVPEYLKALDLDIDRITGYLKGEDYNEIGAIAHRLKGEGGTYGFDEAGKLGAMIQSAAGTKNAAEIHRLVNRLTDYLEQIELVDAE